MTPDIPTRRQFLTALREFERREHRDAMYNVATYLIEHFWAHPDRITDGLGVLLLTWNQAFYRGQTFDFDRAERTVRHNWRIIAGFRGRAIESLSDADNPSIERLFEDLLPAFGIVQGTRSGQRSPVSVGKALHLLAPRFFPIWDTKIAKAWECYYDCNPAQKYVSFCKLMKGLAEGVLPYISNVRKPLLKLVDEYNYAKYTKRWV